MYICLQNQPKSLNSIFSCSGSTCCQPAAFSPEAMVTGVAASWPQPVPLLLCHALAMGLGKWAVPFGCGKWENRNALHSHHAFKFSELNSISFEPHKTTKKLSRQRGGVPISQLRSRDTKPIVAFWSTHPGIAACSL